MKSSFVALLIAAVLSAPVVLGAAVVQDEELKVDLNRAGIEELVELPGIGRVVAERIIAYREENGRFDAPEELMNVRGIGEKTYLKLEPHLVVSKELGEQQ